MFPNESPNAGVLRYGLVLAVAIAVVALRAFARTIVYVGYGEVRDFGLKDIGDIVVEYGHGVRPAHGQCNQSVRPKWSLECREVARGLGDLALVIPYIQVQQP